ncbi:MAG: MFS transporter [Acidobacteria bacterium]|nr:MAG: MFS transporter [Acidobacteriota bacterium]
MASNARQIIRTYLAIAGLYTFSVSLSWGINTLFLLDAGLDIFGTFVANAAFTAGMVAFEIPTGVLADTRGRRLSFLLSVVVLAIGVLAYVGLREIGGGLLLYCLASVILGLGFTFYSGAVEAWLVDALKASGFDGQLDRVFARGQMVTGAAMLLGAVGGGLLATIDLGLPYLLRVVMLVPVFVIAWRSMHDLGFTPRALDLRAMPREMKRVAGDSVTYGWRVRPVRLLMIMAMVRVGFLIWAFYAWQPYFLQLLGRDAAWVAGLISALMSLAMIAGNAVVDVASRFCGRRTTLMLWAAAIQSAASVAVGLATSFGTAVAFFLLSMAAGGVIGPVKQAYLHHVVPSAQRATVISFDSLLGSAGGIAGQTGLGYLARARGIGAGYVAGGLATVLALPLLVAVRRLGGAADRIAGESAGKKAPCAAQGLPEVAAVDATPRQATEDA